ncbi:MAG: DUF2207 domain-containing protein [Phototrophicales bacterium]|nr:DUF2207 domain-containing protein [Phototrophicales bacterium]
MQRKVIFLLTILSFLFGMSIPLVAQSRSAFFEEWNVDIFNVDTTNNSFTVRETLKVRFSGTFRFGTRVIPLDNLDDITNVRVTELGVTLRSSCVGESPGTYCVQKVQEGLSITYYFNRTITNASQMFEIEYDVDGAIRVYTGGDQIWWRAVPDEKYGFSVGTSTLTVRLPLGYAPREGVDPVVTYGATSSVRVNSTLVVASSTQTIGGSEFFEIRAQYPHDPNARKASWQDSFDSRRDFEETQKPLIDLGIIAISLLVALSSPLAVYALWYSKGRDPKIGIVPEYLSEPPSGLPPAIVGTLIDEKADLRDVLSTLIDLAHRGYMVIEEDQKKGLFGIPISDITFKRTDKPVDDLRKFEKTIIKRIFGGKLEKPMKSLQNKFYQYIPELQGDLYEALVDEKLLVANPNTVRNMYAGGLGGGLIFLAIIVLVLVVTFLSDYTMVAFCLPVALFVMAMSFAIGGNFMPRKTQVGAEESAKWQAFRRYLQNLDKYAKADMVADQFEAYLPYAVAFGVDRAWIRRFSQIDNVPAPIWYYPTYRGGYYGRGYQAGSPLPRAGDVLPGDIARAGGGGLDGMAGGLSGGLESLSAGLSNMLESASQAFTSRPQSASGGSSGSWSSGGSSWSGGGFSGGGSSGGGSAGFG